MNQPTVTQVPDSNGRGYHEENSGYYIQDGVVVIPSSSGGRNRGTNILGIAPEGRWPVVRDPLVNNIDIDRNGVTNEMLPGIARDGVERLQAMGMPIDPNLRVAITNYKHPTPGMNFVPPSQQQQSQPAENMSQQPNNPYIGHPTSPPQGFIVPNMPPPVRQAPQATPQQQADLRPRVRFEMQFERVSLPGLCHSLEAFVPGVTDPGRPPMLLMAWDTRAEDLGCSPPPRLTASGDRPLDVKILVQDKILSCIYAGMTFAYGHVNFTLFLLNLEDSNLYPPNSQDPMTMPSMPGDMG